MVLVHEQTGSAPGRPPEASVDTRVISTPLSRFSFTPYSLAYRWKPSPALNRYLRAEQPLLQRSAYAACGVCHSQTSTPVTSHRARCHKSKSAEQHDSTERQIPPGRTLAASCCAAHLSWSKKSSTDGSVSPVSVPSPSTCTKETTLSLQSQLRALLKHASPALSLRVSIYN